MSVKRSLAFAYLDRYASLVVAVASSMAIARLLTPAEIGVYSVTVMLLAFVATFRDMGAGGYLVQEKELTVDRVRAVWTVQLGLGLFLALLVIAASGPVARFYDEPRMRDMMLVVALNYAVNPFGSLTYAWQMREMRFAELALVRFCATLAGAIVSIFLAWRGFGPISLAIGSFASILVNAMGAVSFRPKWFPWMPGLREIRRVLAFGSQTTGASLISTLCGSAPELLLGKLQGMAAAGLFSRANGLVAMFHQLILQGLSSVASSWFARESRANGNIAQPFLRVTATITLLGWSFALGTLFLARPAIRLLYGEQWDGAVDVARLAAGALACTMPAMMCGTALVALGAVRPALRATAVSGTVAIAMVGVGASFGLLEAGAGLVLSSALGSCYWLIVSQREIRFRWLDLLRSLGASATVAGAASIGPALAFAFFGPQPETFWLPLALGVPGAALGFVAAVLAIQHPLLEELRSFRRGFSP